MSEFGNLLHSYRRRSIDPDRAGFLTQSRLGELFEQEIGIGFTGAAVSEWERGSSQISKDDRMVLVGLIKVLHRYEGIKSLEEANAFLLAGNYRPLDNSEAASISVDWRDQGQELFPAPRVPFGQLLRKYRRSSLDELHGGSLTQTRFAEILGEMTGSYYLAPTISNWERGRISHIDRPLLVGIIKVLVRCGGIKSLSDADQLLIAGNYPPLNTNERHEIREIGSKTTPSDIQLKWRDDVKPLNEAKLLLVGQGGVGKTAVVKRLLHSTYDPFEGKTEGIDIGHWFIRVKTDYPIRLNIWDFGGQEIYHATHQFFLTTRSLYLLVIDARQGVQEGRLEYWLKLIESFGEGSPIIVVINKIDQHFIELDRRGLQRKYPTIKEFIYTSCVTGEGFHQLHKAITDAVVDLPHIHTPLPATWVAVKGWLEEMKSDFISYDEYLRLCQAKGVYEEQEQRNLIRFLHDLGTVLSFQGDRRLEDTNVLNPEWVTNGVYQILNSNLLLQSKGVLYLDQLGEILDRSRYPSHKHPFIMDIMRKFELCFPFPGQPDRYLIPELLSKEEPNLNWNVKDSLAFQYHYDILPSSILSRFIVRIHSHISTSEKEYGCWHNGVVVSYEGNRALIRADQEDRKIFIWVTGNVPTRRNLLSVIRAHFNEIHISIAKLELSEVIPIPGYTDSITYAELINLEANGINTYFYARINATIGVQQLLNGIEDQQERNLSQLHQKLIRYFSHDELRTICFNLGMDYEDVAGESRNHTARELLRYLERRGLIPKLIDLCRESRPGVTW